MAGHLRLPVFVDWRAAKYHCQNIGEKVAKDKKHDCPGAVFELVVHAKEAEVEEKDCKLVQP